MVSLWRTRAATATGGGMRASLLVTPTGTIEQMLTPPWLRCGKTYTTLPWRIQDLRFVHNTPTPHLGQAPS